MFLPFGEERPLFLEIGLVGRQVDHRRVGLDLPEVGVDGEVQGQVAGQADLAVQAAQQAAAAAGGERVAGFLGRQLPLGHGVGDDLDLVLGLDAFQAPQLAEVVDEAGRVLGDVLPGGELLVAVEEAPDLQAEGHLVLGWRSAAG